MSSSLSQLDPIRFSATANGTGDAFPSDGFHRIIFNFPYQVRDALRESLKSYMTLAIHGKAMLGTGGVEDDQWNRDP